MTRSLAYPTPCEEGLKFSRTRRFEKVARRKKVANKGRDMKKYVCRRLSINTLFIGFDSKLGVGLVKMEGVFSSPRSALEPYPQE